MYIGEELICSTGRKGYKIESTNNSIKKAIDDATYTIQYEIFAIFISYGMVSLFLLH